MNNWPIIEPHTNYKGINTMQNIDNIVYDADNQVSTSSNSNTTWRTQYWDKRNKDIGIEQMCADYVDTYWFSKYPDKITFERVTDDKRQKRGEDVIVTINASGRSMVIDEKAKTSGCIGQVIGYPCLEVLCKNQYGTGFFESWFATSSNTTTHYAMISLGSNKAFKQGEEWKMKPEDITCMCYGLVHVAKLKHFVEKETGKTIKQITEDAWAMIEDWEQNQYRYRYPPVKSYSKDGLGNYIHMKMTTTKKEQPINLMVRRDYLRNNGLISEVYIDPNKVCKYQIPNRFDRNEVLMVQGQEKQR